MARMYKEPDERVVGAIVVGYGGGGGGANAPEREAAAPKWDANRDGTSFVYEDACGRVLGNVTKDRLNPGGAYGLCGGSAREFVDECGIVAVAAAKNWVEQLHRRRHAYDAADPSRTWSGNVLCEKGVRIGSVDDAHDGGSWNGCVEDGDGKAYVRRFASEAAARAWVQETAVLWPKPPGLTVVGGLPPAVVRPERECTPPPAPAPGTEWWQHVGFTGRPSEGVVDSITFTGKKARMLLDAAKACAAETQRANLLADKAQASDDLAAELLRENATLRREVERLGRLLAKAKR